MKYMGSKDKYAKYLLPFILANRKPGQAYIEPFCGGCNMIDKVDGLRIATDLNKYLIAMWQELQNGWIPPKEISRELYNTARTCYNNNSNELPLHVVGYIGFNGSYGGRFYSGGYAGVTTDKFGKIRNYPAEAWNNVMIQVPKLENVIFLYCDYKQIIIPENSIIYCDPPYEDTKKYEDEFDNYRFWMWCREQKRNGHQIFVSEYQAPPDFKCLISINAKSSLSANGKIGGNKNSVEKLFTI